MYKLLHKNRICVILWDIIGFSDVAQCLWICIVNFHSKFSIIYSLSLYLICLLYDTRYLWEKGLGVVMFIDVHSLKVSCKFHLFLINYTSIDSHYQSIRIINANTTILFSRETGENWQRYLTITQNGWKKNRVYSRFFWLYPKWVLWYWLTCDTRENRETHDPNPWKPVPWPGVWVFAGWGPGTAGVPQGYPWYSLGALRGHCMASTTSNSLVLPTVTHAWTTRLLQLTE